MKESGFAAYTRKTHGCGELRKEHEGEIVTLLGWVKSKRDHGGLVFIDLRDRSGIVQIVSNPEDPDFAVVESLRPEWVVEVKGIVKKRPVGTENFRMATGEVEVLATEVKIIREAKTPPFEIEDKIDVDEKLRLKYRYLDLRRDEMRNNIIFRHLVTLEIRNFLSENGFLEIETPCLTKSTPEGARDFLVPSRLNPGKFYALPQSPQLFKQILMVSGVEKYFQIARCFRDEDLRADRQPEHTQIDIEISFADEDNIMSLVEEMLVRAFQLKGIKLNIPFQRMTYKEAMASYGTDKPDLRYTLELSDLSDVFQRTEISIFKEALREGAIYGLPVPSRLSRKELDELTDKAKSSGAAGLAWFVRESDEIKSPLTKFLTSDELDDLLNNFIPPNSTLLVVAGEKYRSLNILGELRELIARRLNLINKKEFKPLWITDFPMFEWDEDENRWNALHHPFTRPKSDSLSLIGEDPSRVYAHAYDLVINGVEVGGGSLRIFDKETQSLVFRTIGIMEEEATEKFGFLLESFEYGVPPHGGIALGLDRLVMVIADKTTIRDVIAFPKTQSGSCLLTGAPEIVSSKQLKELKLKLD